MKEKFSLNKLYIFIGIAAAVTALLLLIMPKAHWLTWRPVFIIIAAVLFVGGWALPFILNMKSLDKVAGEAIGAIYFKGLIFYSAVMVLLILLVLIGLFSLKWAFALLVLVLIGFGLFILFSGALVKHVSDVAESEMKKTAVLDELKSKAESLSALVNADPGASVETKQTIKKIAQDIRYLSPSDNPQAIACEGEMLSTIEMLMNTNMVSDASRAAGLSDALSALKRTCLQRKNIY